MLKTLLEIYISTREFFICKQLKATPVLILKYIHLGTLISTWLLAFAYKNTKHILKHKLAVKREAAVTKEMTTKMADDKKLSKQEKDERILWKKNEVGSY